VLADRSACFGEHRFVGCRLRLPEALPSSQNPTMSGNQVYDHDDQRNHKQKVNQAAGDVEGEAQNP
jgi:hypothetical protein